MADTQFTTGPWQAFNMVRDERGDAMTPDEMGEYVANSIRKSAEDGGSLDRFLFVSKSDGGPDICHIGNGPLGPSNAHLIAASPELYEALEDVLGLIPLEFEQSPMVAFAKAALAKARGEAV